MAADHHPAVSAERLRQLLAAGESDALDYKGTIDLRQGRDVVELAKDVGAFLASGGDIVVGANDDGSASGSFTEALAAEFDPTKVDQKLGKYIEKPFGVQVSRHELDGQHYVVLHIEPSPEGVCVFKAPGTYQDPTKPGSQHTTFRVGDVFVREGAQSTRWQQHHVRALLQRIVASQREEWLRTHRTELEQVVLGAAAQRLAAGPARSLAWTLDAEAFEETLIELLRRDDNIPVRLFAEGITRHAKEKMSSDDENAIDDFRTILDRVGILAAVAVRLDDTPLLRRATSILVGIYDAVHAANHADLCAVREQLWLDVIVRVYGIGALAVRRRDWTALRTLVLQETFESNRGRRQLWLRHAVTHASRAGLVRAGRDDDAPLPGFALELAKRSAYLRPDLVADDEALLDSILQFDLLACAVVIHETGDEQMMNWLPEFAFWYAHRVEPAIALLISDRDARAALVPRDDTGIAHIARVLHAGARQLAGARYAWHGWELPGVAQFLDSHPEPA